MAGSPAPRLPGIVGRVGGGPWSHCTLCPLREARGRQRLLLTTLHDDYEFVSPSCVAIAELVALFLEGLKERSVFTMALQDRKATGACRMGGTIHGGRWGGVLWGSTRGRVSQARYGLSSHSLPPTLQNEVPDQPEPASPRTWSGNWGSPATSGPLHPVLDMELEAQGCSSCGCLERAGASWDAEERAGHEVWGAGRSACPVGRA